MLAVAAPPGAAIPSLAASQSSLQSLPARVPDPASSAPVSVQPVGSLQPMSPPGLSLPVTPGAAVNSPTEVDDAEAERVLQIEQRLAAAEAEMQRLLQEEIRTLAQRDREVRAHEQAHLAVGGQYAGPVSYDYQRGPDGRLYAVGGSVAIDTAPIPDDPQATLQKMQQVQRAALAPAEPSAQDLAVAAQAAQQAASARAELAQENLPVDEGEELGEADQLGRFADVDRQASEVADETFVTSLTDAEIDPGLRNRAAMASYQSTEQNTNLASLLDLRA